MLVRFLIYGLLLILVPSVGFATHNRSGSITYEHLFGNTYEFTVTTCTQTSSDADRPELGIDWGDGTSDTLVRLSIDAESIYDIQTNIYKGIHTFTGPATYVIRVEDPNRNFGVLNITNSVDKVFCIQTELVISPFIGSPNNSLIIENCPCPEFACVNQVYRYNISAFDPDGDSLSYAIVPSRGEDCLEMSIPEVFRFPNDVGGGDLSIDPISGTLTWDSPGIQGPYNVAIKISEFRNGLFVGSVIQDMQFEVIFCTHEPPSIEEIPDTCIFVGTELNIPVTGTDPVDDVFVFATGAVFNLSTNPATFDDSLGLQTATGLFNWTPGCSEASNSYYTVNLHVEDMHPGIQLTDLSSFQIKVNIPPVENLTVMPLGNTMNLDWDPITACDNIVGYNVYRSTDSTASFDDCCEKGAPLAMGFTLIGTSETTDYIDEDNLIVGNTYCYVVTAITAEGVESCVSDQVCEHLNFEIPVLTNVSINLTDVSMGDDTIYWSYPKELNTTVFPGPYHYQLYRGIGVGTVANELIYTSPDQALIENPDTVYNDLMLNTQDQGYTYRIELYNEDLLIGSSISASSIYINLIPNDNEIAITWEESTPWENSTYEIYRETPLGSGTFSLIGTTNSIGYTDTALINGTTYCYRVKSIGSYTLEGIVTPIENWSQENCAEPIDLTPPCAPILSIDGDCELEETYLTWNNPNNSCADDVTRYNLYFASFQGDSLEFLTRFDSPLDTSFTHKDRGSIAGCYFVTALDSIQYNNESLPSNIVCIDNCDGFYELPNIFTPDASGTNDLFHPILPFKFVQSVEFKVQSRWGETVFETTDPFIFWDGKNQVSGELCSDGVYFYTIIINEIKLEGLIPRSQQGTIQIVNGQR